MKRILAKIWFWLSGWKMVVDADINKARHSVMIAAPHTTNWDFIFAITGFWLMGLDLKYFIKDSYTKSLLGFLFKATGAIGVNREKRNNLVEHSIELLKSNKNLVLLIPAEGTRSRVEKWKTGFYHITLGAEVPLSLGFVDYKNKKAGLTDIIDLTGDFEKDMTYIQNVYSQFTGKCPENYNPKIF